MTKNNNEVVERVNEIFAKFKQEHRHVTGGLQCYSELNEVEKQAAFKGIEFTVKHLMSQNEQQKVFYQEFNPLIGCWYDCDKETYESARLGRVVYTSPPKQAIPDGCSIVNVEDLIKLAVSYCEDGMHPDDLERDIRAMLNEAPTTSETNTGVGE